MKINFNKNTDGLLPAIIQDYDTKIVLMLGYMNEEALVQTQKLNRVTFYSRSKKRLWTKGEESKHYLNLINWKVDCDGDTILIQAKPDGPTCHQGTDTCWGESNQTPKPFLNQLEKVIKQRRKQGDTKNSYVASLFEKGINKIAQKVGEEAIEVVIEAKDNNDALFLDESADLLFHFLILLQSKSFQLDDVIKILKSRHQTF